MEEGRISLNEKELKRIKVLERVECGAMGAKEGAESLGVTERQLRRLRRRYAKQGEKGVIHGNKGRRPRHALSEEQKTEIVRFYEEKYVDSNFTHYSELLAEHEGIRVSESCVGKILRSAGHKSKRRRKKAPKGHRWRDRRSQVGMLWQTDATPFSWLGEDFGRFALHAAIDDATGIIVGAMFTRNECADGYNLVMQEGIKRYGIPLGLYSDKHTIFRSPKEKLTVDQELDGEQVPHSNFGKAMAELHIEHIKANTPQAKGRIERLWGTLQDRLPVELRLLGVKSIEEANRVLPSLIAKHNEKYAVVPADENTAYMPLEATTNLDHVFAIRSTRKIGGGNSISYKNSLYAPAQNEDVIFDSKITVEVRETRAGEVVIWHRGRAIALRRVETRPRIQELKQDRKVTEKHKPAENHPWRTWRERKANQGCVQTEVPAWY